ncbi:MAG: hypothetical protein ACR2QY_05325 [Akkermansiaceae bacterium]
MRVLLLFLSLFLSIITSLSFVGCSGGIPALVPRGYIVKPSHLSQFTSGGSLSTLWYRGSDSRYHYFSHLWKVTTNYRVKISDLILNKEDEFEFETKDHELVAHFANPGLTAAFSESDE